jgi:hypothetical protein
MVTRSPEAFDCSAGSILQQVATALEEKAKEESFYPGLTRRVVLILRQELSQYVGVLEWRTLLDQQTLQYALEESIAAIALYEETMASLPCSNWKHIAVDVCAGKGLYSFLLSYLRPPHLESIVMIENAAINWYHIKVANNIKLEGNNVRRPHIHIWEKMNLHEHDIVVSRLLELPYPLVLTGIHLCKQLSPAFCGLVNALGRKCLMSCLVPCCLPRVLQIPILGEKCQEAEGKPEKFLLLATESNDASRNRFRHKKVRKRHDSSNMFHQRIHAWCFFCHDPRHLLHACSLLQQLSEKDQIKVRQAACIGSTYCQDSRENYECDCPIIVARASQEETIPIWTLDLSTIGQESTGSEAGVLNSHQPMINVPERYCQLLSTSLLDRSFVMVVEAPLENSSVHHQEDYELLKNRKKLFIWAGGYNDPRTGGY